MGGREEVRILHLSDTHNWQWEIGAFPPADLLLHTGDFTSGGMLSELDSFSSWLGHVKGHFRLGCVAVLGNHEFCSVKHLDQTPPHHLVTSHAFKAWERGFSTDSAVNWEEGKRIVATWHQETARLGRKDRMARFREVLHDCTLLDGETLQVGGLRIHGCSWEPEQHDGNPDLPSGGYFSRIPECDILLTHCPALGVLDRADGSHHSWGASAELAAQINRVRPRAHLFGHVHEQRGYWLRDRTDHSFVGGVEYTPWPGKPWPQGQSPPPPWDYGVQDLVSNGSMQGNGNLEKRDWQLVAGPRLIVASRGCPGEPWEFKVPGQ